MAADSRDQAPMLPSRTVDNIGSSASSIGGDGFWMGGFLGASVLAGVYYALQV